MSSQDPAPTLSVGGKDRDARLAGILAQMMDAVRAGADPRLEVLGAQHPDLATELAELWEAVRIAEGVASSPDGEPAWLAREFAAGRAEDESREFPRDFGDFELVAELGRGGMGIVFEARQKSLDRVVAIKMPLGSEWASAADLARFRAEAEAAARLHHPNIVPVYAVGEYEGRPYFVMKFVDGVTLAERLAEGPLSSREAAHLMAPVCEAISYAHENGVLHRDLKPSNILIDRDGRPHVSDFGLAKRVAGGQALTRTGAVLGTPCYMAPEQAAAERGVVGPASDIYSLGSILYTTVTGRPPFQGTSPIDTILRVLNEEPLAPRLVNPKVPRDMEMIVLKCLQKPPSLRYRDANEVARDLIAFAADEPVSARSGVFSQVVAGWFRETHHATVLINWGLLWMWHSLVLIVICLATDWLQIRGVESRGIYAGLWTAGLGAWAAIFWRLRRRSGPVTFIERQIAHVWASSMIASSLIFLLEMQLDLPPLTLSPILPIVSGMVFLIKAGMLSGEFYIQSAALYLTAILMPVCSKLGFEFDITLYGVVCAACFFIPGLKHFRQTLKGANGERIESPSEIEAAV